jgi:hypothetical protein
MSPELYILLGIIFLLLATIVYLIKTHAKERLEWTQAMIAKSSQEYADIRSVEKKKPESYVKTEPDLVEETAMDDNEWLKTVVANAGKKQ